MRTTITLDPDAEAAIERFRHDHGVGLSAAVNELVRRGVLAPDSARTPFVQRVSAGHAYVDPRDIGEMLGLLDEEQRPR